MIVRLLFLLPMLLACNPKAGRHSGADMVKFTPQYIPGPRVLVYKTKGDYRKLVPVLLSEDRSSIVSYPHPSDLKSGTGYSLPVVLEKGYLLDQRGIGPGVAFLKLRYEEFASLHETPDSGTMFGWIVDKDPLVEMYDCGVKSAFTEMEKQLNELIRQKQLPKVCKKIR